MTTHTLFMTIAVAGLVAGGRLTAQPSAPPPPLSADVLWHVAGEGIGAPVHDDTTVYFLSKDREVVALDTATGTERWKTGTGVTGHDTFFGMTTAGIALALDGPTIVAGDWDVVAFDRISGRRRWIYTAPDGDGPGLFLGPAAGGVTYAGSVMGRVYALDTATGRLKWRTSVVDGQATVFEPVVTGESVYVGFTVFTNPSVGGMARIDTRSGRVAWRTMFPKTTAGHQQTDRTGGPVVVDDLVFGSVMDGNIYAFDAATGAVRWALPKLTDPFSGGLTDTTIDYRTLVRVGQRIVAGSTTGTIVAYDIDTREEAWRFNGAYLGSTTFNFSADASTVYLPFFGGFIVALDADTGKERWRYGDSAQGFIWAPDPAGDRVYAAAGRAGFYAITPRIQEPEP